ncbi:MAG: ATP-NAD kinase family protein [Actinomycetota bacterium]|nr:ATP-NAD kinase family protein [Actinomycetota bacterium]
METNSFVGAPCGLDEHPEPRKMRLGLIVNPIAGMGGRLALKGSDDVALVAAARERGVCPNAPARATEALRALAALGPELELLAYAGAMGECEALDAQLAPVVLGGAPGPPTSAQDTRAAATEMADRQVDLLLFAGGDGTAVDICDAIGDRVPVLGIPAGVKMHSAVFAVNPRSAGELAVRLAQQGVRSVRRAEVMDVDETLLRAGSVSARLHGFLNVPDARRHLQSAKARSLGSETAAQEEIAHHLVDNVLGDSTWLIGPGTTTGVVLALLGLQKTLLGVDVVRAGACPIADADERALIELLAGQDAGIIVTPVGGQGFLFGRGNQQLSASVIRQINRERIVVVSTEAKIARLGGAPLRVDTGDPEIDASLGGYTRITVGYNREIVYPVV